MTLSPKLQKHFNEQINNEMSSSYAYLAMAAWFEQTPYVGFAQWMFAQGREETMHALKFYQYLVDMFNNVPYTEAAQPGVINNPKYDDAKTIYEDLIKKIVRHNSVKR